MQDRVSLYPGRVKLTPVSGKENTYDMVRDDEPTQEGTPLNKNTLLKDATAALFGLGTDAVPDDVLSKIKTLINSANTNANTKARIATGSYTGTGTYGASNPCSLTFDFVPKLLIVGIPVSAPMNGEGRFQNSFIWVTGNTSLPTWVSGGAPTCYITASGKTISWYTTIPNPIAQANDSGHQYTYFAVG